MILELLLALTLRDMAWLAGRWEMATATQCVDEQWTEPSADMLIGMSRTVADGRTANFEFLRIEARADGIYYVAQPGGRPPVDFKLVSSTASELIFVNHGHADRVKRVVYRRGSDGNLTARIEGENGGKPFAEDYAYHRPSNSAASRCGAVK